MRNTILSLIASAALGSAALAGTEYSGKQVQTTTAAPQECWYADTEFNVSLWGTYVFTDVNWERDTYLQTDHAWGGGIDLKYFLFRYFGVGVEGWLVDA